MPTLTEATQPINEQGYKRVPVSSATDLTPPPFTSPDTLYSIRSNTNLRSPSPPINVSPDNLRQYYRGGQAPQYRVLSPPTLAQQGQTSVGGTVTNVVGIVSGTSGTTTVISTPPTAQTVGFVTPALLVGQIFTTVIQIAKAFDVLGFGVSAPARIRLYKTAQTQAADSSRSLTQRIPLGTQHGIICDMQLQQPNELSWKNSPDFPGSNGDSPQTPSVYLTVTNIGAAVAAISLTITYVSWES